MFPERGKTVIANCYVSFPSRVFFFELFSLFLILAPLESLTLASPSMAPSLIDIQLTNVAGRRAITARDEEEGDLEDVRLLDSYDEEAAGTREEEEKEARRIQVRVTGMTCSACTSAVEGAISALPGVVRATVSLLQNKAHVVFDPSRVKVRSIFFFSLVDVCALCWCFSATMKLWSVLLFNYLACELG